MNGAKEDRRAVQRARWLAELADAIDDAQLLAWRLYQAASASPEALELPARLAIVRAEIESLRRGSWRNIQHEAEPLWTGRQRPPGN